MKSSTIPFTEVRMAKIIECHKVNPSSDRNHVVRGRAEDEVMRNAEVHAREHGMEPTPELMAQVRSHIEEDSARA
jgi:predicted small metal-binding protein